MKYKFSNIYLTYAFLLITVFITGCGGGGSSSDSSNSASQDSQAFRNTVSEVTSKSKDDDDRGVPKNSDSFPQDTSNSSNTNAGDSGNSNTCSLCDPEVTVSWEPSREPEVIGYEVWYSITPDATDLQFYQDLYSGQPGFDASSPEVTYSALKHLSVYEGNICFAVKAYSKTEKSPFSDVVCGAIS